MSVGNQLQQQWSCANNIGWLLPLWPARASPFVYTSHTHSTPFHQEVLLHALTSLPPLLTATHRCLKTLHTRGVQTANHFGTPLKVYGRDNNRHREGRRNFVEHVDHEDPIDKSKRTRVRFNVEGPHGHGMAYAEVCVLVCLYV